MPTNTDLVTDLPADFEVFGQAVATSMADLLGGTTGQILSKTTNADMDFTWIANDQGDITGVTAGTGISGGGTSGTVTVTNSMATAITTSGDILYGTGSGTFSRLGIGTAGQVLTVNGGATAPSWTSSAATGGMTLLTTTSLSGSTTTISLINQTYTNLRIFIKDAYSSSDAEIKLYFNADSTTANYVYSLHRTAGTANNSIDGSTGFTMSSYSVKASNSDSFFDIEIPNYANTTTRKIAETYAAFIEPTSINCAVGGKITWSGTAAISSINIQASAGTFSSGSVEIYGVK